MEVEKGVRGRGKSRREVIGEYSWGVDAEYGPGVKD